MVKKSGIAKHVQDTALSQENNRFARYLSSCKDTSRRLAVIWYGLLAATPQASKLMSWAAHPCAAAKVMKGRGGAQSACLVGYAEWLCPLLVVRMVSGLCRHDERDLAPTSFGGQYECLVLSQWYRCKQADSPRYATSLLKQGLALDVLQLLVKAQNIK